jgi:hypothetical protein
MCPEQAVATRAEVATRDQIIGATRGYCVEDSSQWMALTRKFPGVTYFATDLDPRSFEFDEINEIWVGRADLLLTAPSELRPGQDMRQVSFMLPVRVVLAEKNGTFSVEAFDFCADDGDETA